MDRETVLVTGCAGFIGTNLIKSLLCRGYAVIALDLKEPLYMYPEYRYTYKREALGTNADIWIVRGDVRDTELLRNLFDREIDYIVHLAAISTIQMGTRDSAGTMSINVGGTEALLSAVLEYGKVKGFIYASTDKVYGKLSRQSYTEKDMLAPLDSPYDHSKAEADRMVRKWSAKYGIHGIVLRFCNIYGRYDLHDTRIIPGTIKAMLEEQECVLRMYRDPAGKARNFKRDFLYIEDLCEAITQIMDRLELWNQEGNAQNAGWGEAFNLGAGRCYSIDKVIWKIQDIIGYKKNLRIEIAEGLEELPKQRMDYAKAEEFFGFVPKVSLEAGLRETVMWWQEQMMSSGKISN